MLFHVFPCFTYSEVRLSGPGPTPLLFPGLSEATHRGRILRPAAHLRRCHWLQLQRSESAGTGAAASVGRGHHTFPCAEIGWAGVILIRPMGRDSKIQSNIGGLGGQG